MQQKFERYPKKSMLHRSDRAHMKKKGTDDRADA